MRSRLSLAGFMSFAAVLLCTRNVTAQIALINYHVVQQSDSAQLTFNFDTTITIDETTPCFLGRFQFSNFPNQDATGFARYIPRPGTCIPTTGQSVVANLDPRDFSALLENSILLNGDSTFLEITNRNFILDYEIELTEAPIPPAQFTMHAESPSLLGFDVDLQLNRLFLHFTDLMILSRFEAGAITLINSNNNNQLTLNAQSQPVLSESNYAKTICVILLPTDLEALSIMSVCAERLGGCSCSVRPNLVVNYVNAPVLAIADGNPLQVSNLREQVTGSNMDTFSRMQLTVDYVGCTGIEFLLEVDEVYQERPGEYIKSIGCIGSTIRSVIPDSRSFPVVDSTGISTFFIFNDGDLEGNYGRYLCESEVETFEHYIVNTFPFIGLPEGKTYSTQLFSSLTIPLFFGSDPQLNLQDERIEIRFTRVSSGRPGNNRSPPDPGYRRLSRYRAEVYYPETPFSVWGEFTLEVRGAPILIEDIFVTVTDPSIFVTPSVIALLPTDTQATLMCNTNSPNLDVFWVQDFEADSQILSSVSELIVTVPQVGLRDRTTFYCGVRDPENPSSGTENALVIDSAAVANIPEPLSVYQGTFFHPNRMDIPVVNRLHGDLFLRCIGHAASDIFDLVWVSDRRGEPPILLTPETPTNYSVVSYGYNEANLTIDNFFTPYRGTVRCQSISSGEQAVFNVVEGFDLSDGRQCSQGDVDSRWKIEWDTTVVGTSGSQPCPFANNVVSEGFAFRRCAGNGEWAEEVDVIECKSFVSMELERALSDYEDNFDDFSDAERTVALASLTRMMISATNLREGGLFPFDLQIALSVLNRTIQELGSLDAINNILDESNTVSWRQLNENTVAFGSQLQGAELLFQIIERFSLIQTDILTSSSSEINLRRSNIVICGRSFEAVDATYTDIIFPESDLDISEEGQFFIPREFLVENSILAVISTAVRNLQNFMPIPFQPIDSTITTIGSSIVLSIQVESISPVIFGENQISFVFNTFPLARVYNPRCMFWDTRRGAWDDASVTTIGTSGLDLSEFKTFRVEGMAHRLAGFVVLVDQDLDFQEFEYTISFIIGCAAPMLFSFICVLVYLISFIADKQRKYSLAPSLIHVNFCCAIFCSYFILITGITPALSNLSGCITISAFIHYFFTAAFTWLLCEILAIILFKYCSKQPLFFILFFIIGWGFPFIPMILTLIFNRDQYSTSTQCWFYFDGEVVDIVLAFIIPKALLLISIAICVVISLFTTFAVSRKAASKGERKVHIRLLSFTTFGVVLLSVFLVGSWVFAMIHVTNYQAHLSAATSGWTYLAFSIALSFWLTFFSVLVSVVNHEVDYEVLWETHEVPRSYNEKSGRKHIGYTISMSDMSKGGEDDEGTNKDTTMLVEEDEGSYVDMQPGQQDEDEGSYVDMQPGQQGDDAEDSYESEEEDQTSS